MTEDAVGESVDLKVRGVRVVISIPAGGATPGRRLGGGISILGTGIVPPLSTAAWRAIVEESVSALAAQGETTLVLCAGTREGARRLLPQLPEACFVEAGDFTGAALRRAVEGSVVQVVVVGVSARLARLASGVLSLRADMALLAEITSAMGGSEALAEQVSHATPADAYALWESEGLQGRTGRELCRRTAVALEQFAGPGMAAQVVLVDESGQRMIAMYGRLAR